MQTVLSRVERPAALLSLAILLALSGCLKSGANPGEKLQNAIDTAAQSGPTTDDDLRAILDEAIDACGARRMNTTDHAAWQIVHGILAYGPDLHIEAGSQDVPALKYLLEGGELNGWKFMAADHGLDSLLESGTKTGQGHEDQWLGYLSQIGMPPEQTLVVREGGQTKTYTIHDLVTQAQWKIHEGAEATWTLMGLSTYLPLDARWMAKDGTEWTLERMIAMEAAQNMNESACGGMHRLYGLSSALNRYRNELNLQPEQLTGGWKQAHDVIRQAIQKIKENQQQDGSFSVKYLERASTSPDVALRLNTSGHTLEFLTLALTDAELQEPWVVNAAYELSELFLETTDLPVECGGLYHSAHGLQLYRLRRFGPKPGSVATAEPVESGSAKSAAPHSEAAGETAPADASPAN